MREVARSRQVHRDARSVRRVDRLLVTHRAAGLDDSLHARVNEHLQSIRKDCALLELASLPGGFCTEAQALPGYLAARGLPGQYAPESAAAIIRSAIFRSLNQEEAS